MNWSFLNKIKLPKINFNKGALNKSNLSQRKFLWIIFAVAVALAAYSYGIVPLVEAKKKADDEIAMNSKLLQKYAEVLQNRKSVEEGLERVAKQGEEIQKRLIPGETPQLGAANLQDSVKRLAEKNNVAIRSFRNLDSKDVGVFRRISVQIEFNPLSSMQSLSQFLYELEHQQKEITIREIDLLVFNPRMPNTLQGSMIISGYMKGGKGKEKEREKGREKP
jgi:hypothetical protein